MHQADLNTAQQRADTCPVGWQVGQEAGHNGGRGHRSLQHSNEGVAIDGLHHLHMPRQAVRGGILQADSLLPGIDCMAWPSQQRSSRYQLRPCLI